MERYICKECGAEVFVDTDGNITRTCDHTTTVILDIEVVATGEGGMGA